MNLFAFSRIFSFIFIFPNINAFWSSSEECPPDEVYPKDVNKLDVKVFYNSALLDWGTNLLLLTSVCDEYEKFDDKMTVNFYPLTSKNDWNELNLTIIMHACAVSMISDSTKFLCCSIRDLFNMDDCLSDQDIHWKDFQTCIDNKAAVEATKVLEENRKLQLSYKIPDDNLPAMVFNDVYDTCTDYNTYENFVDTTCRMYSENDEPSVCSNSDSSSNSSK